LVARLGLTMTQTGQLVTALLAAPDDAERRRILDAWANGRAGPTVAAERRPRAPASPALLIALDISHLCRIAARLEARLLERPLSALGAEGAATVRDGLAGLGPVLDRLRAAVEQSAHPRKEVS
jgi:hypothetical protein